jgi:hypothetical protein
MSDVLMDSWQQRIVWDALAAASITEDQALLLAALYRHADYTTRVISDFRAERACEWLGRGLGYVCTMRKRLQVLREAGWFDSTYQPGVKTPYDVTMRAESQSGAPHSCGECHPIIPNTLVAGKGTSPQEDIQLPNTEPTVTLTPRVSPDECGAPLPSLAPSAAVFGLRARVYAQTGGEMLARVLTPGQTRDLLDRHSVDEICYAIGKRLGKVSDKREFHRSFRAFLLDGGIQIELDAAQRELRARLKDVSQTFCKGVVNGRQIAETPADRVQRVTRWLEANANEFEIFPEVGHDAAALVYSVGPETQRQPNSAKVEEHHAQVN